MLKFTRRLVLVVTVALATVAPGAAPGADPMPCRGLSFTDEAGGSANRDIREGWFSFSGGRLTANLRLAEVDQRLETGEGSATFVMYYGVRYSGDRGRGAPAYVSARTDGTTWAFEYGDDSGGRRGATTGSVQAGPHGVIEIEIPSDDAVQGDTIIFVHARTFARAPAEVTGERKDYAPGDDRDYGADFPVEPCPAPQDETKPPPGSEPQPTPAPPASGEPAPTPTPTPSPPEPVTPEAEAEGAPFTVRVPPLRARLLRRTATFKVVVDPSAPVERLTVSLSRRGKLLARGRRASLTRAASVKLKVRRRITRGTYRLKLSGRRADGRTVSRTVRVRVA